MSDAQSSIKCVIDADGLLAVATASGNIRSALLNKLRNGEIAVLACTWSEFSEIYEDEAALICDYVTTKIPLKKSITVGAARVAEDLNSGFSRGAYDRYTELYTAAFARLNDCPIFTSPAQYSRYGQMKCSVIDIDDISNFLN